MKRIIGIIAGTTLLTVSIAVWLAHAATITAPTSFTISASTITPTTLSTTWTLGATGCDSVNIIHFSGGDTLFIGGNLTNTAVSKTLTGLNPKTQYILALRIRRGDSTAVSNLDTMYTAWPNIEPASWRDVSSLPMYGARSWLATETTYDTLYVPDATGLDSTMVYRPWEYTGIQAKIVAPHADSAKVLLKVIAGYADPQNIAWESGAIHDRSQTSGAWGFKGVAVDSINVTQQNWTLPQTLSIPASSHFYIVADGQTDNGHTTKVILRMFRARGGWNR